MSGSDNQEDYKQYFFYILFKRKWLIIVISILGIAGTAIGTYVSTPLYKATSKIRVRSNISQEVVLFNDLYQQVPRATNIIPANNFIEVAGSETLARALVEQFELDKKLQRQSEDPQDFREYFWYFVDELKYWTKKVVKYPYNLYKEYIKGEPPKESEPNYTEKAVKKFRKDTTELNNVAESDIIKLTIWGESPKEAEAISRELTNLVIQRSVALEQSTASYGYDFSKGKAAKARKELGLLEDKMNRFKQKREVSKIDRQKEIKLDELDDVEKNLISVNTDLSSKKARLEEGRRQINEQKKMLTSLDSYQNLLNENISLSVDINALKAKQKEYESARQKIKAELRELVDSETELKQLEREVELKEQLFNQLSSKHDKLDVQRVSQLSGIDLSIIDSPTLAENAEEDWPDWYLNMGIGIPSSILVAIILAFMLELLNDSFWTPGQITKRLNIPVLGTIQEIKKKKKHPA
ncbi:MAG: Wzz/FepE/Etk N-terminal domain-containing protein [Nitrospirota bacterium]